MRIFRRNAREKCKRGHSLFLQTITRMIRVVYRESPRTVWAVVAFYASVYFVNMLSAAASQRMIEASYGGALQNPAVLVVCACVVFLSFILLRLAGISNILMFNRTQRDIGYKIMRKVYERVGEYGHIHFANGSLGGRMQRMMLYAQDSMLTQNTVHWIAAFMALMSLLGLAAFYWKWGLYIGLIVAMNVGAFLIERGEGERRWQLRCAQEQSLRYAGELKELFIRKDAVSEMRVLNCGKFLFEKYALQRRRLNAEALRLERKIQLTKGLALGLRYGVMLFTLAFGLILTLRGSISPGLFSWLFIFQQMIANSCNAFFAEFNMVYSSLNDICEVMDFLDAAPSEEQQPDDEGPCGTVTAERVSFSYTHSEEGEKRILTDVSLHVRPGEKVLLLGLNGSGKTTLIKNLLGLLTPESGHVALGRQSAQRPRDVAGVVWQDYMRYEFTLRENIGFGAIERLNDDAVLYKAMACADVNGELTLDQPLGKMFSDEGRELSGGQWQRVAIARGCVADKPLLVMDEPTASMDPLAEMKAFREIVEQNPNKTVILAAHRMGFARLVDRVIIIDSGKVIQVGSHDQLVNQPGRYRDLYLSQRRWYEDDIHGATPST